MTSNETINSPVLSTRLSIACIALESINTKSMYHAAQKGGQLVWVLLEITILLTCIITYQIYLIEKMLNLKLYFTTKPNGQLRHLIPPSSLYTQLYGQKNVRSA